MKKKKDDKISRTSVIDFGQLSPLELKVAQLVRSRIQRNGIAVALAVAVNTVKTILSRVDKKLGEGWRKAAYGAG